MKHSTAQISRGSDRTQRLEQRSIPLFIDIEGVHSLPFEPIDRSEYIKTDEEKLELQKLQKQFMHTKEYTDQYGGRMVHNIISRNKPHKMTIRIATKRAKRVA